MARYHSFLISTTFSLCGLCVATLFVPTSIVATEISYQAPKIFLTDMKLGDSSPEVLELQKFLNNDPETIVAKSGPGSPGNETNYFGKATEAAVVRFQNKYKAEILLPAGLGAGTGRVGLWTRLMLNKISLSSSGSSLPEQAQVPTPAVNPVSAPAPNPLGGLVQITPSQSDSEVLSLAYPSIYAAPAGASITLFGSGFSTVNNTVYVGSVAINAPAQNSSTISITIPRTIAPGRYDISLSNNKGTAPQKTFFVVTDGISPPPMIERVEPVSGPLRATITVVGKNFTATGNEIRSNFGIISNISSSDGQTLSFTLDSLPNILEMETSYNLLTSVEWKVYFHIVNGNGVTSRSGQGVYTIKK